MAKGIMIHVRVPAKVLEDIDALGEDRTRGALVTEALQEFVSRRRQTRAVKAGRGLLADNPNTPWKSDKDVDDWVVAIRSGWDRAGE